MIFQRLDADRALDRFFAILACEGYNVSPAIVPLVGLWKLQCPLVGEAQGFQDSQDRRKLDVLFRLLEAGNRPRADLRDFGQALLRDA